MNADALSDLVLLLVCGVVVWFHRRERPALAVAAGLNGLAGRLGWQPVTARASNAALPLPTRCAGSFVPWPCI